MSFAKSLNNLLVTMRIRPADLSRATGISKGVISGYLSGKSTPTMSSAILIADYLGVSLDELAGRTAPQGTSAQREMDGIMKRMNEHGQEVAIDVARGLADNPAYIKSRQLGMVEKKEESA